MIMSQFWDFGYTNQEWWSPLLTVEMKTTHQVSTLVILLLMFTGCCFQLMWVKKITLFRLQVPLPGEKTAKQSVFLSIQVCASSQTKGLERGWKRRVRLGRDASVRGRVRLARFARVRLLLHALSNLYWTLFLSTRMKKNCTGDILLR